MTEPIVKSPTVPLSPERAFRLFTAEIADWWPLGRHTLSAGAGKTARGLAIEPRVGGAVTETMHDGATALWGSVTTWEPGRAFAMSWHVGGLPEDSTRVTVTFRPVEAGTEVCLVHDGWEAAGTDAAEARGHYANGWDAVFLDCFGGSARARAA